MANANTPNLLWGWTRGAGARVLVTTYDFPRPGGVVGGLVALVTEGEGKCKNFAHMVAIYIYKSCATVSIYK